MKQEALEVLTHRRSVRKFQTRQVEEKDLQEVLKAGIFAPTAKGMQSPTIIVAQDPTLVARLSKLNAQVMGSEGDPYYGAPTILLVLFNQAETREELGILDSSAVTTNLLNAAYAVGLGSCWINRCRQMFEMEEGKQLLKEWGLPETMRGVTSIALGYPNCELPQPKERKENYVYRF